MEISFFIILFYYILIESEKRKLNRTASNSFILFSYYKCINFIFSILIIPIKIKIKRNPNDKKKFLIDPKNSQSKLLSIKSSPVIKYFIIKYNITSWEPPTLMKINSKINVNILFLYFCCFLNGNTIRYNKNNKLIEFNIA